MSGPSSQVAEIGLSKIAHALRRVGALYIAALVSAEGTSDDSLLARADKFAHWAGGRSMEAETTRTPPLDFLGENPWADD